MTPSTSFPRRRKPSSSRRRPGSGPSIGKATLALLLTTAVAPAFAQHHTEWRAAYMECGKAHVRALAECYENTALCVSETLTFMRSGRRAVVGTHQHYATYELDDKLTVKALDYHASSWACVAGKDSGHYVSVVMAATRDAHCSECSFVKLYDSSGRLVAASVGFDARGRPHDNAEGARLIRRLTTSPAPRAFAAIYKSR